MKPLNSSLNADTWIRTFSCLTAKRMGQWQCGNLLKRGNSPLSSSLEGTLRNTFTQVPDLYRKYCKQEASENPNSNTIRRLNRRRILTLISGFKQGHQYCHLDFVDSKSSTLSIHTICACRGAELLIQPESICVGRHEASRSYTSRSSRVSAPCT